MVKTVIGTLLWAFILIFVIKFSPFRINERSPKERKHNQSFLSLVNSLSNNNSNTTVIPKTPTDIIDNDFTGDWHSNQPPFNYFGGNSGKLRVSFDEYNNNVSLPGLLYLEFLDGSYLDKKVVQINKIQLLSYSVITNISNTTEPSLLWYGINVPVTLEKFESLGLEDEVSTHISFNLNLTNAAAKDCSGFQLILNLWSADPSMNINITSTVTLDTFNYSMQTFLYSLTVSIVCIIQIIIMYRLIKISMDDESMISKVSILTVGWEYTVDTYLCLLHLWMAIYRPAFFHFFIVPTILYFILASIFEMRFLMFLWKARYYATYQNMNALRRGLILFFVKLYIILFVVLILLYFFILVNWFIVILHLFLIPQIYHTAKSARGLKNLNLYLLPFTAIRILIPLYFRGCPSNLFQISPSESFDIVIGCLMIVQVLFCLLQWCWGPRCFIPAILLPPKFNYYVNHTVQLGRDRQTYDECIICLFPLHEDPENSQVNQLEHENSLDQPLLINNNQPQQEGPTKTVTRKIMKTPCEHRFHIPCLKRWLNIKLECPTCRKVIPSLE